MRVSRWKARRLVLVGVVACVAACDGRAGTPQSASRELPPAFGAMVPDTGLWLAAYAPRDTVTDPDSLMLGVVFRSGRRARRIVYGPEWFSYTVLGPDGRPLPVDTLGITASVSEVYLAPNQFWGQVVQLSCPVQQPPAPPACLWNFRLITPGEYRLVAEYSTPPAPGIAAPVLGRDYYRLTSDTVRVIFAPR